MSIRPTVSVIIPTLAPDSERLANLLADLAALPEYPSREVIVQAGGTFAENVNRGVKASTGELLVLLNDDVRLRAGAWNALTFYEGEPWPNVRGLRLLYPNGLVQHGGIGFDQQGNPYTLWALAPACHPEVVKDRWLTAVTFACASVPRSLWLELGGLDEGYRNAYEDVDFCLRAREHGWQTLYIGHASAVHAESQTPGRHDHDGESWAYFARKWLETGRLWSVLGVYPFTIQRGGAA